MKGKDIFLLIVSLIAIIMSIGYNVLDILAKIKIVNL